MPVEPIAKKRRVSRDSLLLLTEVKVEAAGEPVTVRVRNLSPHGMMIDANEAFREGANVSATIRKIGSVPGKIAWVIGDRVGISFDKEIDASKARCPAPAKPPAIGPLSQSRRPGLKVR